MRVRVFGVWAGLAFSLIDGGQGFNYQRISCYCMCVCLRLLQLCAIRVSFNMIVELRK
jgi:hypothetical protein